MKLGTIYNPSHAQNRATLPFSSSDALKIELGDYNPARSIYPQKEENKSA